MAKKKMKGGSTLARWYLKLKVEHLVYLKTRGIGNYIKSVGGGYKGKPGEFRRVVVAYWKKFGVRPSKKWYTLYCNGRDAYEPRFIPDSMWHRDILPYFNNLMMRWAYADKGMYNRLLPDVKKPETVVKNVAGYFYNGDGDQPITREEAIALCEAEDHLIFKPSLNSGGGGGIQFYDKGDPKSKSPAELIDKFKVGFVAQRLVKQHADLARIHATSLNTVRVMSFRFKGEVHILSAQLRMGGGGARVDNYNAGGCACAVKPDGWLEEKAVTRSGGWTDHHESGIKFKDIRVPNFEGVIETVKRLHKQLPYFNIIGWDFAVGEDGTPIFMEFNVTPTQNQVGGHEPTFGALSDEVFEDVFVTQSRATVYRKTMP